MSVDLLVPDIGNFTDVDVVEVLVKPGDAVELETPLITIETDKASMDVPAAIAGKVTEVLLKPGDKVSKGSLIARLEAGTAAAPPAAPRGAAAPATAGSRLKPLATRCACRPRRPHAARARRRVSAAPRSCSFRLLSRRLHRCAPRAADLGLKVTLVERWQYSGACA